MLSLLDRVGHRCRRRGPEEQKGVLEACKAEEGDGRGGITDRQHMGTREG